MREMNNANSLETNLWWCPACKIRVEPSMVTFDETHDLRYGGCGNLVRQSPEQHTWVRVSDRMPEAGVPVIAYLKNELGKGRRIRAFYATPRMLEVSSDLDGAADHDEETDTYYTPEGWYEDNEYEETHWKVTDPITHWMALPEPPNE